MTEPASSCMVKQKKSHLPHMMSTGTSNFVTIQYVVRVYYKCNVACNFEFAVGKHHHTCSDFLLSS